MPGHGKGKGLAFMSPPYSIGAKLGVPGAMPVQKGPRDRNIIPLIFILRCFVGLFFPLYQLSTYLYETIEDMEQDKSTLASFPDPFSVFQIYMALLGQNMQN